MTPLIIFKYSETLDIYLTENYSEYLKTSSILEINNQRHIIFFIDHQTKSEIRFLLALLTAKNSSVENLLLGKG